MTIFTTFGTRFYIGPPQATDLKLADYLALDTGSFATGSFTFSAQPINLSILTLNGTAVTFKTTPTGALDVLIGATLGATLENLIAVLATSSDAQVNKMSYSIQEDPADLVAETVVLVQAVTGGTGGNSLTIVAGSSPATNATASGATLTGGGVTAWTEILEIESLGDFGDTSANVNFSSIQDGRVRKLKGSRDAGNMALICGFDARDPGQLALRAAQATSFQFAFKMVASDKRLPSDEPTIFYFNGLVESQKTNFGTSNNVAKTTFTIGINTAIGELPSAPAGTPL